MLPRAQEAREILPDKLREMGALVDVVAAYRTVCGEVDSEALKKDLLAGAIDLITFTSSSTVTNLVQILGSAEPILPVKTACIGPITADTARQNGIEPDITADTYTIDGMIEAIRQAF